MKFFRNHRFFNVPTRKFRNPQIIRIEVTSLFCTDKQLHPKKIVLQVYEIKILPELVNPNWEKVITIIKKTIDFHDSNRHFHSEAAIKKSTSLHKRRIIRQLFDYSSSFLKSPRNRLLSLRILTPVFFATGNQREFFRPTYFKTFVKSPPRTFRFSFSFSKIYKFHSPFSSAHFSLKTCKQHGFGV